MKAETILEDQLETAPDLRETVQILIHQMEKPAALLEFYYWSQEPGMLEFIRAILVLPSETRAALEMFLSAATSQNSISATLDPSGALILRSKKANKIATSYFQLQSPSEN